MTSELKSVGIVGGGVIGGAWAARFVLNGIDCRIYDPHPDAQRVVGEVMANASRAFEQLTAAPLPPPGDLSFVASVDAAVDGAQLVQESVPERLGLKQSMHAQIDAAAAPDALVGSSTSGLLPTDIQRDMRNPGRMFVAHPYNPVYLLPLVELVGGAATDQDALERARDAYTQVGMQPVVIRKEIDAFVGDRLLEAVWREALWLIKEDVTTVAELDDIMRYSFGMRWAQMGLFQTYRIAGGEAGMRHFINQFGPTLALPWTRLTDVPELDEELTEKIASQSDAQAGDLGIRELERIRDDNLIGFMRVMAQARDGKGWGAGKLLLDYEARLQARAKD
jgi:carnitine 3-dehydrogenase